MRNKYADGGEAIYQLHCAETVDSAANEAAAFFIRVSLAAAICEAASQHHAHPSREINRWLLRPNVFNPSTHTVDVMRNYLER